MFSHDALTRISRRHLQLLVAELRKLYRAMSSAMRLTAAGELDLPAEAEHRWQQMLTDELGDPVRARLVRLVGDGLFHAALTGQPSTSDEVEQLLRHLELRTSPPDEASA